MQEDMIYPAGCRPVTDDLGPDELIRRLKVYLSSAIYINNILTCNNSNFNLTLSLTNFSMEILDFGSYSSSNGSR